MSVVHGRLARKAVLPVFLVFAVFTVTISLFQFTGTLAAADPVIVAAGDIACDPAQSGFNGGRGTASACHQLATYNLIAAIAPAAVLPLGDTQYYCGGYDAFLKSYALSWGRVKSISHPVVGNHEYLTTRNSSGYGTGCNSTNAGASGYFRYFGAAAGDAKKGYYSYNIGAWHLIALNSQCSQAGGCGTGSPQETWLRSDLAAHPRQCILAYWHIPLWSSGGRANSNMYRITQDLYNAGADVILTGHDHTYERFAPQDYDGNLDSAKGIRAFVAGTGGSDHTSFVTTARNSQVRNNTAFGVLKMTLRAASYDWQFVPEAGKTFTDSGTGKCHNVTTQTTATATRATPTTGLATSTSGSVTFKPVADAFVDAANPATNYGASTTLRVDASPTVNTYFRFNVQGLSGLVTKATLRIYSTSSSSIGFDLRSVSSNTWGETSITYGNAPTMSVVVASAGGVTVGTWNSVDVTSLVRGNGLVSLALTSTGTTSKTFSSRESGANAPQLIVQTSSATPTRTLVAAPSLTPTAPVDMTETPTRPETPEASVTPVDMVTATPITPEGTITPAAPQVVLTPVADTYVYESDPTTNYGTSPTLRVAGSPVQRSYLRFDVQGLDGSVSYASLRIYANSSHTTGFSVYAISDNTWDEETVHFQNAPALDELLGSSGPISAGNTVTIDLSNYVTGNGTFSLALVTTSPTAVSLASREAGANEPELIVETGH